MLSLIAWFYGKIVDLRNYLYDRGVLDTFDLGARTISLGNITTGGTGKTPLVAYVAEILSDRGEKVCVLTRGYGRKDENRRVLVSDGERVLADFHEAGDEPVELARRLLGKAIVIADADRVSAAEWAKRKFGVTAFVLDDGFQHRRVRRDVDIVCIDATNPFGGEKMLPAGHLRERVANLERANAIVITRSDLVDEISNLKFEISNLVAPDCVIFTAENAINGIVGREEFHETPRRTHRTKADTKRFSGKRVLAFCGLGNPDSFFEMLHRDGLELMETKVFQDHHVYTQQDILDIEDQARNAGAEVLLTTAKDGIKLSTVRFEMGLFIVEIDVEIDNAEMFDAML